MAEPGIPEEDLERAGTLLMVAGFLAALVAGLERQISGVLTGSQWMALLGMLLAVFPVAFSAVALYEVELRPEEPSGEPGSTG